MPDFDQICRDFCVNQKLALKMDLPAAREPVLDLFGRLRKDLPRLSSLQRYPDGEVALESGEDERDFLWVAMRQVSLKSGWVNPETLDDAYRMHRTVLEVAPYFLSISPLDVDHLELVYAFDFECDGNRDEAVLEALLGGSPLGDFADASTDTVLDAQPFIALALADAPDMHVYVEVRTRLPRGETAVTREGTDPLSVMLTVRRTGPVRSLADLPTHLAALSGHGERLVEQRLIPRVLMPLRDRIERG